MQDVGIVLDIDWAPDFVIDFAAQALLRRGVRATWFITHASPAVDRLREHPELFELGLHPNFRPGSSHGGDVQSVLTHCMELVPEARSIRTHGLIHSSQLCIDIMNYTPVRTDVSLYVPSHAHLQPTEFWWGRRRLLRVPFIWEDDLEMQRPAPCWIPDPILSLGEGLKVFAFHPIHIYLNAAGLDSYERLKQSTKSSHHSPQAYHAFVRPGLGVKSFFLGLLDRLAEASQGRRICDLVAAWENPAHGKGAIAA